MEIFSQSIFISEIQLQCRFAIYASQDVKGACEAMGSNIRDLERRKALHGEVFRAIHSLLTHLSNVSLILWPSEPSKANGESDEAYEVRLQTKAKIRRSRALRATLGLETEHPLKSRTLRDHLEHYDERLDKWDENSAKKNIVSNFIGPLNAIVGIDPTDRMRSFDPATTEFTFRGETFNLSILVQATAALYERIGPILEKLIENRMDGYVKK